MEHKQYIYKAIVTKVVDGDTFDLKIDLGFDVTVKHRIRLYGVDAYETSLRGDTTEEEKRKGIEAKAFLIDRIFDKEVIIETVKDKKGKYGRYLANVCHEGKMVSEMLVEKGYVKGKRQ
ncbi:MAG TPA: nuclease [Flavobacteriaceae bacterium]|nr:nuclease [Flavobacteriaceae bacterium]